ncbi:HNH endonuclease [Candidatus Poribacteria bacterium]|nr:HNH endonuclease [Candidatus Poribacteria bacterium]
MNYMTYIRSSEWKEKRKTKLEDCNSKCECEGGCVREATQVHHLHYDTLGNESLEDLQALCAKCHMAKTSKVRNFYGNPVRDCCLVERQQEVEKTLPYDVWNEANFHLQMDTTKYSMIAEKLGTDPIIAALLDNLGIMFACGDISVTDKVTEAISQFADVVPAKEAGLDGYCDIVYKIKPEFEKYFIISEE